MVSDGTEADLGYGGPCSHLKLHLLSKGQHTHSGGYADLWRGILTDMHFAFQKRYSRQTLDKFHIFITVPVLKINIFFHPFVHSPGFAVAP